MKDNTDKEMITILIGLTGIFGILLSINLFFKSIEYYLNVNRTNFKDYYYPISTISSFLFGLYCLLISEKKLKK